MRLGIFAILRGTHDIHYQEEQEEEVRRCMCVGGERGGTLVVHFTGTMMRVQPVVYQQARLTWGRAEKPFLGIYRLLCQMNGARTLPDVMRGIPENENEVLKSTEAVMVNAVLRTLDCVALDPGSRRRLSATG